MALDTDVLKMVSHLAEFADTFNQAADHIQGIHEGKVNVDDLRAAQENLAGRMELMQGTWNKVIRAGNATLSEMSRVASDYSS